MSKCVSDVRGMCVALTHKNCEGCNFFRTQEEYDESLKKSRKRLIEKGLNIPYENYSK